MQKKAIPHKIKPMECEPWVELAKGTDLDSWGKPEEIIYNQVTRQAEKYLFFRRAFDFLSANEVPGDYHEFGCHRCRTFRMALTEARIKNFDQMKFFAFDSFEGLPESETDTGIEGWQPGALATSEAEFIRMVVEHDVYADRVRTIPGFYSQTLTEELQGQFLAKENKIALATIDCDFYESAVPVFDFIEPLLQPGTLIYIDDLFAGHKGNPFKGVGRAFLEYQQRSRWRFVRHLEIGWWGRSYIVYEEDGSPVGNL